MSGEMMKNGKIQQRLTDFSGLSKILSPYFPGIDFSLDDSKFKLRLSSCLARFFSSPSGEHLVSQCVLRPLSGLKFTRVFGTNTLVKEVDGTFSLPLDFLQFRKLSELQEFCAILESKPKDALLCMSAALHKVFFEKLGDESFNDFVKINIRLHN